MTGSIGLRPTIVAAAVAMTANAAAAAPHWVTPFSEPLYLVETAPERGTGVVTWRLVPAERRFDAAEGMSVKVIGGPYGKRFEVELDRNRLAGDGHPTGGLVPVAIQDADGKEVDSFDLGAKPVLADPRQAQTLEGTVEADFAPVGRHFFPLPFVASDFIDEYERLRQEFALREVNDAPPDLGTIVDRMQAVAPLSATAGVSYSADCNAGVAEYLGGDPEPFSTQGSAALGFERGADGSMEIVDAESPAVRLSGASDGNGGFDAILVNPEFTVNVSGVVVEDEGGQLRGKGVAGARLGKSGFCSAVWQIR
jgi:hypothetical protein